MAEDIKISCARPIGGPITEDKNKVEEKEEMKKEVKSMILIGRKAPDFSAPAYHNGSFVNVKLSDYSGKWVVLCFYPGDFTFV